MNKSALESLLISIFPGFQQYWDKEDIHREEDGTFTPHGIMSSFFFYYKENYKNFSADVLREFSNEIEKIVASDPNDTSDVANAICTSFLEMIAGEEEGKVIEPYLGKACKEFYSHWL